MIRLTLLLLLAWPPAAAAAGSSAHYRLDPACLDSGGPAAGSVSYSLTTAMQPGGSGSSTAYSLRSGYAGQLSNPCALTLAAVPPTVAEGGTRQLYAWQVSDDGAQTPLLPGEVTWFTPSGGPVTGITTTGLAGTGPVYQNTVVKIRGTTGLCTDWLDLTVLDSVPDNFSAFAADGLPDAWQARYFGPAGAASGPQDDPDGDGLDNLLELASGSSPSDRSSGYDNLRYIGTFAGGPGTVYPGLPLTRKEFHPAGVDHRALFTRRRDHAAARLRYRPQFSTDLSIWTDGTAPLQVLADDGIYQTVSIAYPIFPTGTDRWFFRVTLELTNLP